MSPRFRLEADSRAQDWLSRHRSAQPRVIAYETHRCCGGGKICEVKVREMSHQEDAADFDAGTLQDGTVFLIDRRAASRLPSQFRLTARGFGPLERLDLELEAEQWGTLLYD